MSAQPPQWLTSATQALRKRYPHDRIEVVLRSGALNMPEWRVRCLD
ncbi:hypothetical protein D9613_011709 [Agrocybe pediades]|uniref:Uncharacterized protein n=1 Tax=Agrocybe pediades TaxID=84607 RepID=A0A8H4QLB0_9AGAR|nr:hypothetical protein D9613_011709 [Agrocybe pediades]